MGKRALLKILTSDSAGANKLGNGINHKLVIRGFNEHFRGLVACRSTLLDSLNAANAATEKEFHRDVRHRAAWLAALGRRPRNSAWS